MTTQVANAVAIEAMAACSSAFLTIENAGDYGVRINDCQSADERDRILVRTYRSRPRTWQGKVDFTECTTLPAQREMRCELVALDFDNDFFE